MRNKFYITTPIYYVNDVPHAGHAYTTVAADILARYWKEKLGEKNVFFLTGTDEHGQKVAQAAQEKKLSPKEYADSISPRFQEAWDLLNIKPNYFIRTTDPRHEKVASELLQKVYDAGYIYKGTYEGLYCIGCEKFLTKSELINDKCPLHPNKKPIYQKEKNYFLKLGDLSKKVLKKINNNEYKVEPPQRKHEILSRLERGVEDISISREGVSWGIPIPWDKNQTIYVWVEALMNYYSATQFLPDRKRFWPADLHIVGKDILWFHSVIWQAILIVADIELPRMIFAHGFFTIDGQKMSKSLGNVISPKKLVDRYGVDATRYLLISAYTFGTDGDISFEKFDAKYNADLANGLGNLVARVAKLCEKNKVTVSKKNKSGLNNSLKIGGYIIHLERSEFNLALEEVWRDIKKLDGEIERDKPWSLPKEKVTPILQKYVGEIQHIAHALKPFLPETAERVEEQFRGPNIKAGKSLFPRLS